MTAHRSQQTISRPVEVKGIGFLSGADVTLQFLPAPPNYGIAFQRVDRAGSPPIPARIENVVPRERRTAIAHRGVCVEMIEHVMAALTGLRIDNCLVQLNGPEPPGCDGSARTFVDCLSQSGVVDLGEPRQQVIIENPLSVSDSVGQSRITAQPRDRSKLFITYQLDYGQNSPIASQTAALEITPESFIRDLAFARTFLLEAEARALQAQGYGRRATANDLLVFNSQGVIDNELRATDECARHKILDCLGDFALLGCDLFGQISAFRSGHYLNHELVRQLGSAYPLSIGISSPRAA